jgi:osmoprotectant transport system permease protein
VTDEIVRATVEHVVLVVVSVGIATLVGVPLGVLLTRRTRWQRPVMGAANVVQTIPSLALFGLLIPLPLFGIGTRTALVALTLYALLPILRNTVSGIATIDPALREAAVGMGMTDRQLLRRVELPLAASVILAGIRLATVIGVGLATIAAPIGAGGLGTLVFSGVASLDNTRILAGAVPAAGLALVADAALGAVERRLRPPR